MTDARVNLFIKTSNENVPMGFHTDVLDSVSDAHKFKTILLYLEDSNGYTEFEKYENVMSKRNRACIFSALENHQTVSQSDIYFRTNVNVTFMEKFNDTSD